jgi:dCMP deaminase
MDTARLWASRSTCTRAQVGAVLVREGRSIGTGYNGAPAGMPHCNHTLNYTPKIQPPNSWMRRVSPVPVLKTSEGCRVAIHAESNAIAYAARHGVAIEGADLFVTLSPCFSCAQLIIAAGLNRVIYDRAYRDPAGLNLLIEANVLVEKWIE